ncbi:MAG: lipopolysaccharide assembly protein LapA domain-containing protein [Gammaproteobacteria bacterium]|nr:lipopolysaccharide assembly protein LapA domain-containing protein [Gammaproteobacteria bacterium]
MTILKRIALALLIVLIFTAMIVFTAGNPGELNLKLLHWEITAPISLAFTSAFAIGWLFGVVCMGLYAFKLANERRLLRRNLRMTENEVSSLRSLPLDDAD